VRIQRASKNAKKCRSGGVAPGRGDAAVLGADEESRSRLREGMTANGLDLKTQDKIVENVSLFALYGFPESHAASFALIAYASAYLKVKYSLRLPVRS
jgi:hypothetical protein